MEAMIQAVREERMSLVGAGLLRALDAPGAVDELRRLAMCERAELESRLSAAVALYDMGELSSDEFAQLKGSPGCEGFDLGGWAFAGVPGDRGFPPELGSFEGSIRAFQYGLTASAVTIWDRLANRDELARPSQTNLGVAHGCRGDLPDAIEHFQGALEVDSAYVPALINLARVKLRQGEAAEARDILGRVSGLEDAPSDYAVSYHGVRGEIALAEDAAATATNSIDAALKIAPDNRWALSLKEKVAGAGSA